jgi:hypothetical protein
VVVLLGLLTSAVFAARVTVDARRNQQAADYVNAALEAARSLDYASVSMLTSDLGSDPNITTVGVVKKYDPGTGAETLDYTTNGTITPHRQTISTTNGSYTTKRYVTLPATATVNAQGIPSVRRVTVEVSFPTTAGPTTVLRRWSARFLPGPRTRATGSTTALSSTTSAPVTAGLLAQTQRAGPITSTLTTTACGTA